MSNRGTRLSLLTIVDKQSIPARSSVHCFGCQKKIHLAHYPYLTKRAEPCHPSICEFALGHTPPSYARRHRLPFRTSMCIPHSSSRDWQFPPFCCIQSIE